MGDPLRHCFQATNLASYHDHGTSSLSQAADAICTPGDYSAILARLYQKERPLALKSRRTRPTKAERMKGKLLAEIIFRAQSKAPEKKHCAEVLFLKETFGNPALQDYASTVFKRLQTECIEHIDRGEDPALTAARLPLPGAGPLLDSNSSLPIADEYHHCLIRLGLDAHDVAGDSARQVRSPAFGEA